MEGEMRQTTSHHDPSVRADPLPRASDDTKGVRQTTAASLPRVASNDDAKELPALPGSKVEGPSTVAEDDAQKPGFPAVKRTVSFDDQTSRLSHAKLFIVFLGLSLTIFIAFTDQTSVATAEPAIGADLHAGQSISWVGTSYLIANTSCQLLYGRFSDIFGRKTLLLIALSLFAIGDLVCGFARSPAMLYVFRSIAGIGGGGMTNMTMVIVSDVVSLRDRGLWQGILSVGVALGSAAGPFLGALLTEKVSWRWNFWIMPPCAAVCMLITVLFLPLKPVSGNAREKLAKIDYAGSILSLAANIFVLIPISSGGSTYPWNSAIVISMLVIGGLLWIAFVIVQWKFAKLPILPLRIWTYRTTALNLAATFLVGIIYYGNLFFLPIYLQVLRQMTPILSAAFLLSLLLIQTFSSLGAGLLSAKTGKVMPSIRLGFAIWCIGSGLQTMFDRKISRAKLVGLLILEGTGVGFTLQTTLVAAQAGAPSRDRAVVTGARNCLRSMGGAFGLAMCNAILNNVVQANLPSDLPADLRNSIVHQISANLPAGLDAASREQIFHAYEKALRYIWISFVPIVGVCFILSLLMKETSLFEKDKLNELETKRASQKGSEQPDAV